MDRRLQKVILPFTIDLDIQNCMFTIVHQMVQRVGIKFKDLYWAEELETLQRLAVERETVCIEELHLPHALPAQRCEWRCYSRELDWQRLYEEVREARSFFAVACNDPDVR